MAGDMTKVTMRATSAQSTVEFTFAMITVLFLIYGMVMVFRWAGMDLANRRVVQDLSITAEPINGDPSSQLNGQGVAAIPMAAVYHGKITDDNEK